jgi:hypothetical protein
MRQTPPPLRTTLPQWLAVAAIWGLAVYGMAARVPADGPQPVRLASCR